MSKQSTNRSSSKAGDGAASRQPKLLIVMVFIGGAISTWCWYRPLPKDATNAANGLASVASGGELSSKAASTSKSLWGLEGLVFPSFFSKPSSEKKTRGDSDNNVIVGGSGVGDLPGDLVGDQELHLTPYQRLDVPLKDRVAGEPLPIMPVLPPLHSGPPAKPPLWVDGDDRAANRSGLIARQPIDESTPAPSSRMATNSADLDAPSPFRIPPRTSIPSDPTPTLTESRKWPDEGFQPSRVGTSFRPDKGQLAFGNKFGTEGLMLIATDGRAPSALAAEPGFISNGHANEREGVMALSSNRIRTKEIDELEPPRGHRPEPATGAVPTRIRTPDPANVIRQPRTPSGSKR